MKFLIYLSILTVFAGCSLFEEESRKADSGLIQNLVLDAINGSAAANDSLSGLVDLALPLETSYNKFEIDSIYVNGKTFFTVILEFANPLYNRFAVYDDSLNNLIIDRSLNGYIKLSPIHINELKFYKIEESFIAKDIFVLERLSLYLITPESVNLALRIYTQLRTPDELFMQAVSEISGSRIKTEISSNKYSPVSNKSDIFSFNDKQKEYRSGNEIFHGFVTQRIDSYKGSLTKPVLSPALNSARIISDSAAAGLSNFSIEVTSEWKKIEELTITEGLTIPLTGTKYLNEKLGASISIMKLPDGKTAPEFIQAELTGYTTGINEVRFSSGIESGKDYIQYFEYSCGSVKYILILKASKYTYEKYRDHYNNIINTFKVGC